MQAGVAEAPARRPLTAAEIRNLCIGLFGVQIVWGLQNVNTSRIFQSLGADVAQLPILWIAAPITGLLVQPIVGHLSDRWRGRWGRRKPFIATGALLTAAAMLAMGSAATLTAAVAALWLLTAAVNIVMQPFRSLVADQMPSAQRATGYAVQVCFIGAGAVIASALPWMLTHWLGVPGTSSAGGVAPSVQWAFRLGAVAMLLTVGWTVWRGRDYPPSVSTDVEKAASEPIVISNTRQRGSIAWSVVGTTIAITAYVGGLRREIYLVALMALAYGLARALVIARWRKTMPVRGMLEIVADIMLMPRAMRRLAVTQFLTWFALFGMWVYSVPAVALRHFGTADPVDAAYSTSADWVGVLFALYDGVAAAAALVLPLAVRRIGLRTSHGLSLMITAGGVAGLLLAGNASHLWLPAVAIGLGWASILSAPYAMVANVVQPSKIGVYMGIHNMFLVLPQLVAAACLGAVIDRVFAGRPDAMLGVAAVALVLAGISAFFLPRSVEATRSRMQ